MNKIFNETTDSISEHFEDRNAPCDLFTRTTSMPSDILNSRQRSDDTTIDEWKYMCDCHKSEFSDPQRKHIVTGGGIAIQNKSLRYSVKKKVLHIVKNKTRPRFDPMCDMSSFATLQI